MNNRSIRWVLVAALLLAVTHFLQAQNYTLSPGDSIIEEIVADDLSVFNILQENVTADTLYLSWEKISDEVPSGWIAMICDNSICYPNLHEQGTMLPVTVGEYGLMSLHITSNSVGGTAIIRYAIWETSNPLVKDTLTWVIHSINTGFEILQPNNFFIFALGNQLVIRSVLPFNGKIKLLNLQGGTCLSAAFSGQEKQFSMNELPYGIYLLELSNSTSRILQKILLPQ